MYSHSCVLLDTIGRGGRKYSAPPARTDSFCEAKQTYFSYSLGEAFHLPEFQAKIFFTGNWVGDFYWDSLLKCHANTFVKVYAQTEKECRQTSCYLQGYSYTKLYRKKLSTQKPMANTVGFTKRTTLCWMRKLLDPTFNIFDFWGFVTKNCIAWLAWLSRSFARVHSLFILGSCVNVSKAVYFVIFL